MKRTVIGVIALVVLAASVQADVPTMINYQGKLSTAAGVPVNGTKMMIFQFRDAREGVDVGGAAICGGGGQGDALVLRTI